MYKIRITLDTKQDVIRTILVDNSITLEELHKTIIGSFGFQSQEIASFYRTDSEWNQGEEIPLFNMEEETGITMATEFLSDTLPKVNDKLIYVYDFLNMWTFYVDVIEISDKIDTNYPRTILSVGEIPKEAPQKKFTSYKQQDDSDDEFGHFDDFDFNEY